MASYSCKLEVNLHHPCFNFALGKFPFLFLRYQYFFHEKIDEMNE